MQEYRPLITDWDRCSAHRVDFDLVGDVDVILWPRGSRAGGGCLSWRVVFDDVRHG